MNVLTQKFDEAIEANSNMNIGILFKLLDNQKEQLSNMQAQLVHHNDRILHYAQILELVVKHVKSDDLLSESE